VISSLVKEISLSERPGCAAAAVLVDDRQARGGWDMEHCLQRAIPGMNNKNMFRYLHIGQLKDDGNLEEVRRADHLWRRY